MLDTCQFVKCVEMHCFMECQFKNFGLEEIKKLVIENTSVMQQDKYIFHLYVFSTCFGRDITHYQELQNCTHSDKVMVPREFRRDVVTP